MSEAHFTPVPAQSNPASATTAITTAASKPSKPAKPYPAFPLYPHSTGYWAKKIRGRFYYFGRWADPDAALAKYMEQREALHAGREPRPDADALTVKALCNLFVNHKDALRDAGELTVRTWNEYKAVCDLTLKTFGKQRLVDDLGPDDFAGLRKVMAKRWGPVRLGNTIQTIRSVFKFAADNGLSAKPVIFGQGFQRPSKKTLRLHKAKQGPKLFTDDEIRRMIGAAGPQLRAMILLGINCGFGMADCGNLPIKSLDLAGRWVNYPRPKTGIDRRCPLWPETVEAIKAWLAQRPEPKGAENEGLVFVTYQRRSWHKPEGSSPAVFKVGLLLKSLGINGRKGLGFYSLRHTFQTVADEARDFVAVRKIMGHASSDISDEYRERISDERLKAVADHVRRWLFQPGKPTPKKGAPR